jgi:hypothetical protein
LSRELVAYKAYFGGGVIICVASVEELVIIPPEAINSYNIKIEQFSRYNRVVVIR